MMKFPKEIRQYLWNNFQTKDKMRDKFYEERCQQKQICDKIMNYDLSGADTSDFVLLNNQSKMKMVKTIKSKQGPRRSINDAEAWNCFIENIKNETKIKNLRNFLTKKRKFIFYANLKKK